MAGTSLKVHGLKQLVKAFAATVHQPSFSSHESCKSSLPPPLLAPSRVHPAHNALSLSSRNPHIVVFINHTPPPVGSEWAKVFDYWVEGDTDDWVRKCESDWKKLRPQDWDVQTI